MPIMIPSLRIVVSKGMTTNSGSMRASLRCLGPGSYNNNNDCNRRQRYYHVASRPLLSHASSSRGVVPLPRSSWYNHYSTSSLSSSSSIGNSGIRPRRRRGAMAEQRERNETMTHLPQDPIHSSSRGSNNNLDNNNENEDNNNEPRPANIVSRQVFEEETVKLLNQIHAAMQPLQALNPDMVLRRGRTTANSELRVPSRNMQPVHSMYQPLEEGNGDNHQDPAPEQTITTTTTANKNDDKEKAYEEARRTIALRGEYLLIDLGPVHGQYTLQTGGEDENDHRMILRLQSPLSGAMPYRFNVTTRDWCCINDNHNLVGMLVRDLIRQIQGVPNL